MLGYHSCLFSIIWSSSKINSDLIFSLDCFLSVSDLFDFYWFIRMVDDRVIVRKIVVLKPDGQVKLDDQDASSSSLKISSKELYNKCEHSKWPQNLLNFVLYTVLHTTAVTAQYIISKSLSLVTLVNCVGVTATEPRHNAMRRWRRSCLIAGPQDGAGQRCDAAIDVSRLSAVSLPDSAVVSLRP